jgi:hypothetical protein
VFRDRGELAFLVITVDISLQRRAQDAQPTIFVVKKSPDLFLDRILPADYKIGYIRPDLL